MKKENQTNKQKSAGVPDTEYWKLFLPGELYAQRGLAGCSPWGHKELDTTDRLTHTQRLKEWMNEWNKWLRVPENGKRLSELIVNKLSRISRGEKYNHWNEELSDEFQWLDTARKWIHDLEDGFKDITQHTEVKERDVKYIKERLKNMVGRVRKSMREWEMREYYLIISP